MCKLGTCARVLGRNCDAHVLLLAAHAHPENSRLSRRAHGSVVIPIRAAVWLMAQRVRCSPTGVAKRFSLTNNSGYRRCLIAPRKSLSLWPGVKLDSILLVARSFPVAHWRVSFVAA